MFFLSVLMLYAAIAWHEFGHYITARYLRVGIQELAVGVGPVVFSFRYKGTLYSLRLFPIGGYINPADWTDCEEPDWDAEMHPDERKIVKRKRGWFSNQPYYERVAVLAAGPWFNIAMAFAIVGLFFVLGKAPAPGWNLFRTSWDANAREEIMGLDLPESTHRIDITGPIKASIGNGLAPKLKAFALLNMVLGVLNLLFILPFDGGQIVWTTIVWYLHDHLKGDALMLKRRALHPYFVVFSLVGLVVGITIQLVL